MNHDFHVVVCAGLTPDPLQTLEPLDTGNGPGLKNEMMLPMVIDPWAGHALYEAAHLAQQVPGSKVWLLSLAPKAKLQQAMMVLAQKVAFELVALDGASSGFAHAGAVAEALVNAIRGIKELDMTKLLVFGGWESAARGAGATLQIVGERLGIVDQFQGVDELTVNQDGTFRVLERVEGGRHQVSVCSGPPAVLGWATGFRQEPRNNPQLGMANMRTLMPALQRATTTGIGVDAGSFALVEAPRQRRDTRIEKDLSPEQIASEIVDWIRN